MTIQWVGQPVRPPPPPRPVAPPPPAKKAKGCFFWVLGIAGTSMMCCCLGGMIAAASGDPNAFDPKSLLGPEVALGEIHVPEDDTAVARSYHWRYRQRYGVGYGLSRDTHDDVNDTHAALAKKFSYKPTPQGTQFTWIPPPGCQPQPWSCVFNMAAQNGESHIAPLTELFRKERARLNLDARATAELVVTFVQHITYRLPKEAYFELLPPEIVVADGSGDCDSKALLAAMMLKDLGYETAMLYSRPLAHAALGLSMPGTGKAFAAGGRKYLFVEVTYPGWAIGTLPPQYDKPKAWEVLPLR